MRGGPKCERPWADCPPDCPPDRRPRGADFLATGVKLVAGIFRGFARLAEPARCFSDATLGTRGLTRDVWPNIIPRFELHRAARSSARSYITLSYKPK